MIAARYVSTLLGHTTASVSEAFRSSIGQSVKVNIVYISSLSVAQVSCYMNFSHPKCSLSV